MAKTTVLIDVSIPIQSVSLELRCASCGRPVIATTSEAGDGTWLLRVDLCEPCLDRIQAKAQEVCHLLADRDCEHLYEDEPCLPCMARSADRLTPTRPAGPQEA